MVSFLVFPGHIPVTLVNLCLHPKHLELCERELSYFEILFPLKNLHLAFVEDLLVNAELMKKRLG